MSDDLERALQAMVDEAVERRLPALVDERLRELLDELVIVGVPSDLLPETREHQDAILRMVRERLK